MKTPIALALALLCAALASAADIALKDGRVLRDAVIISQDPTTVTVRHLEGFAQIEKAKLPDELKAQYSIDENAAKVQRDSEVYRAKQLNLLSAEKSKRHRDASVAAAQKKTPQKKQITEIKSAVGHYIQNIGAGSRFHQTGAKSWRIDMPNYTLEDPVPVPGATDKWTVAAKVERKGQEVENAIVTVSLTYNSYLVIGYEVL